MTDADTVARAITYTTSNQRDCPMFTVRDLKKAIRTALRDCGLPDVEMDQLVQDLFTFGPGTPLDIFTTILGEIAVGVGKGIVEGLQGVLRGWLEKKE